jgi:type I restriction enzyme, S subunit
MAFKIPSNWDLTTFGELAYIRNGYAFKSSFFSNVPKEHHTIPLVKQSQLVNQEVDLTNAVFLPDDFLEKYNAYKLEKGDILIGMSGSIGKVCRYETDIPSLQNQRTGKISLRSSNSLNNNFFGLFLSSLESTLVEKAKGMGVQNISAKDIEQLPFYLPPFAEQQKIVEKVEELFSEIDNGIKSLETAKKQLEVYRQSLFKSAFTGNLTVEWRRTTHDYLEDSPDLLDHYQQIREDDYLSKLQKWKELNKEWEKDKSRIKPSKPSKLKKIVESSTNGINKFSELPNFWHYIRLGFLTEDPVYGTSKKCDYESNDGVGVLRIPNISEGFIDSKDLKFAYFSDEEITSYKLEKDDLLTIRSNGSVSLVGKTALVRSVDTNKLFAGYLIRLRPFKQHVNGKYLHYAFESQFVRNQIEFLAKSTSGVNNINSSELQSLIIPIPSLEEQNEIVNQLDNFLDTNKMLSEQLEIELKKASHLKSAILTKAFSGQLVPQDPNDEPASILLERIQAEKEKVLAKANKAPKKTIKPRTKTAKKMSLLNRN